MIYKCPKCGSEIHLWNFSTSTSCDCGKCDADLGSAENAKDYARILDSERWRKMIDEYPECGYGYKWVIYRHRTVQL